MARERETAGSHLEPVRGAVADGGRDDHDGQHVLRPERYDGVRVNHSNKTKTKGDRAKRLVSLSRPGTTRHSTAQHEDCSGAYGYGKEGSASHHTT